MTLDEEGRVDEKSRNRTSKLLETAIPTHDQRLGERGAVDIASGETRERGVRPFLPNPFTGQRLGERKKIPDGQSIDSGKR